jgi:hypothetical protein
MCFSTSLAEQQDRQVAPIPDFYLDNAACFDNLNNALSARDFCHIIWKEPHKKMINEHLAQYSYGPNEVTRWDALNLTSCYGVCIGDYVSVKRGTWTRQETTFCDRPAFSTPDQLLAAFCDLCPTDLFWLQKTATVSPQWNKTSISSNSRMFRRVRETTTREY